MSWIKEPLLILAVGCFGCFAIIQTIHWQGHQERPCVHTGNNADF